MKPAPFEYRRTRSLDEALDALAEHGDEAKAIAGGQSLVAMMNLRLARPEILVDIGDIGLREIHVGEETVNVGALVRQRQLERDPTLERALPLLAEATRWVAHPAIRNRGTIGGSLAHADPTAELAIASLALDATLHVASRDGSRTIPAADFHLGPFTPAIEADELLTEISFPCSGPDRVWSFLEIAERAGDFALAAVALVAQRRDGRLHDARLVLAGAGGGPRRIDAAEAAMEGASPDAATWDELAELAVRDIDPPSDTHSSGTYKRSLLRELVRRAAHRAVTEETT